MALEKIRAATIMRDGKGSVTGRGDLTAVCTFDGAARCVQEFMGFERCGVPCGREEWDPHAAPTRTAED